MTRTRPEVDIDVDEGRTGLLLTPVSGRVSYLVLRWRGHDTDIRVPVSGAAAARLGSDILSALEPGRWDVYLSSVQAEAGMVRAAAGLVRTVRLVTRHAIELDDRGVVPYRTEKGGLTLLVERLVPEAEVQEVWPERGRIALSGPLLRVTGQAAQLMLRERRESETLKLPAEIDRARWSAVLSLDDLPPRRSEESAVWDIWLCVDGVDDALRLGAHTDDVRVRHRAVRYPAQQRGDDVVEPYWTVKGNVSVRVRSAD